MSRNDYKVLPNENGEDFLVKVVGIFNDDNGIKYASVQPVEFDGFEREVKYDELQDVPDFEEYPQVMLHKFLETLRLCSCTGNIIANDLVDLQYFTDERGDEWVRPIFRDGNGKHGNYDVKVTGDSNIAILYDVMEHFVKPMW